MWFNIKEDGMPDFTVHGFHTGNKLMVKLEDGTEHQARYLGWGEFNSTEDSRPLYPTHWHPEEE